MAKPAPKKKAGFQKAYGKTINTKPGRFIFAHLDIADEYEGNTNFCTNLVVPHSDRLDEILKEIDDIGKKSFGAEWSEKPEYYFKPFTKGEEVVAKILAKSTDLAPEQLAEKKARLDALYAGNYQLRAKSGEDKPPLCYLKVEGEVKPHKLLRRPGNDEDVAAITAAFYDGAYGIINVTPHTYKKGDGPKAVQGVGLILQAGMFLKDGPRLGGADIDGMMEEDFGTDFEFESDSDATETEEISV